MKNVTYRMLFLAGFIVLGQGYVSQIKAMYDTQAQADECVICTQAMTEEDSDFLITTECGHKFHDDCLSRWRMKKQECPVCRENPVAFDERVREGANRLYAFQDKVGLACLSVAEAAQSKNVGRLESLLKDHSYLRGDSNYQTGRSEILADLANELREKFINCTEGLYRQTALMWAIQNAKKDDRRMIDLILNFGPFNVEVEDNAGNTALFYAAKKEDIETAVELLSRGANLNKIEGKPGLTTKIINKIKAAQ